MQLLTSQLEKIYYDNLLTGDYNEERARADGRAEIADQLLNMLEDFNND